MKIREKCEKCNNYYGKKEFYYVKNKSEHLKKCSMKIKCEDCTEFCTTNLSLNVCEEELKKHQVQECKGSRKWRKLVACKDIVREDCKHFFIDENDNGPNPEKLKRHLNEVHNITVLMMSCKTILKQRKEEKNNQCKVWFKRRLHPVELLKHLKGPPHFWSFRDDQVQAEFMQLDVWKH